MGLKIFIYRYNFVQKNQERFRSSIFARLDPISIRDPSVLPPQCKILSPLDPRFKFIIRRCLKITSDQWSTEYYYHYSTLKYPVPEELILPMHYSIEEPKIEELIDKSSKGTTLKLYQQSHL